MPDKLFKNKFFKKTIVRSILFWLSLVLITACTSSPQNETQKETLVLIPASFADLPGWHEDRHQDALSAFIKTCERILKRPPETPFGFNQTYGDWQPACRAIPADTVSPSQAQSFFENWFTPWKAMTEKKEEYGLFTGYYEPELRGSLTRHGSYTIPLYKRPDDLIMVDLGLFRDDLKGQRIAGRVIESTLKPYEDRQQINEGQWPHHDQVLVWVDNAIDAFFLHIQGSGRITLPDGHFMRVGYAGQNGHIYYAIGRELIKCGEITKENVSLQSIRQWLESHPDQASDLMNLNRSYVFFKELDGNAPLGGEGLPLTPERSLAIDHSKIPYGIPVWVDIAPPVKGTDKLQKLMIAQDTGGAIQGAIRGDVFWGHGDQAAYLAGHMKSQGRYWLLLPKTENK